MGEKLGLGEAMIAKWMLENRTPKQDYFIDLVLGRVAVMNRRRSVLTYEVCVSHFSEYWGPEQIGTALNTCIQKKLINEEKVIGEERFNLVVNLESPHLHSTFPALKESADPLVFLVRRLAAFHGWQMPEFKALPSETLPGKDQAD